MMVRGNRNKTMIIIRILVCSVFSVLAGLIITGWKIGWGPFTFLQFNEQEKAIIKKYDPQTRKGEILFYGASNFRLWEEMEEDLDAYKVQNHGFGGSSDQDLLERADALLYPYAPRIIFFQTGSNDYGNLKGADQEKVRICMERKAQMFDAFHEKLPDAHFVVMSGLLLPGRSQYTTLTQMVNAELKQYCEAHDEYMTFVDAESMTFAHGTYRWELFLSDGIHLNRDGRIAWCRSYIMPQIEELITELAWDDLRRQECAE